MPYVSDRQRRYMHWAAAHGELDPKVVEEFDAAERRKTASEGVYTVKRAAHPHERIEQRTSFHRDAVDQIQQAVDLMGLRPGSYHLPLRDRAGNVAGYAVFKGVKNRRSPVLSTVYAKDMRPPGTDIETMIRGPQTP
jgi:hypothetical protein